MPENFLKEIKKLEIRFKNFLEKENEFINGMKNSLKKFYELNARIDELKIKLKPESFKEFMEFKIEAINNFSNLLKKESELEHEKSHLLESYGSLLLALEEATKSIS